LIIAGNRAISIDVPQLVGRAAFELDTDLTRQRCHAQTAVAQMRTEIVGPTVNVDGVRLAAHRGTALEHRNVDITRAAQLMSQCQPGDTGADDRDTRRSIRRRPVWRYIRHLRIPLESIGK